MWSPLIWPRPSVRVWTTSAAVEKLGDQLGHPPTQVAEWAGHSVQVPLKVYAKCIDGQDEAARRRIQVALLADDGTGAG